MNVRRLKRTALALALSLAAFCAGFGGTAQAAAPAWKLLAVTGPTNLPPTQSETQRLTVEAAGGTFTLGQQTAEGEGTLKKVTNFGEATAGSNVIGIFFTFVPFAVGEEIFSSAFPAGTTVTGIS